MWWGVGCCGTRLQKGLAGQSGGCRICATFAAADQVGLSKTQNVHASWR
ncbi:hypothetical protein NBRC116594_18690 [Shimia sp. NS0008-38b]